MTDCRGCPAMLRGCRGTQAPGIRLDGRSRLPGLGGAIGSTHAQTCSAVTNAAEHFRVCWPSMAVAIREWTGRTRCPCRQSFRRAPRLFQRRLQLANKLMALLERERYSGVRNTLRLA